MKEEQTTSISTRIPLNLLTEIHMELKNTDKSRSQFVAEAIKDKLFSESSEELINKEIALYEAKINNLKQKLEHHKQKEKTFLKIPEKEVSFLIETKKILEQNPTFAMGRVSLYKNKFGKHYRMSPDDLFRLCYKAEEQVSEQKEMEQLQ